MVRSLPFHGSSTGSSPVGVTDKSDANASLFFIESLESELELFGYMQYLLRDKPGADRSQLAFGPMLRNYRRLEETRLLDVSARQSRSGNVSNFPLFSWRELVSR
jgi:hypothetical protein